MAISFRIGTSGYAYKQWRGGFYPDGLAESGMLAHYAGKLSTVEINNTFYRMPTAATLTKWAGQVPESFLFTLKAPQSITHRSRLKAVADPVAHFFAMARALGPHRGPALFQLPPFMKKDVPRLQDFLAGVPEGERVAVEFRHPSWHDDAVYTALSARNAALCLADTDDGSTPRQPTADWGYVRLRRAEYTAKDLHLWHVWITSQSWQEVFVYFKHEDAGTGPAYADALGKLVADT